MKQVKFNIQLRHPNREVFLRQIKGRLIKAKGLTLVIHKTVVYNYNKQEFRLSPKFYSISEYTTGKNIVSELSKKDLINKLKDIVYNLSGIISERLKDEEVINFGK